jgi:hypothetical protein
MGRNTWLGMWAVGVLAAHACAVNAQDDDDDDDGDGLDRNCLSTVGNVRIGGSLLIAGRCELDGTDVRGNVTLFAGGSLTARNARIRGNLTGTRANFVDLDRSQVDGNVQLDEFVGDQSTLERTEVRGNVEARSNRSKLDFVNNDLSGDLLVFSNTGGVLISGNAIDDDLRCTGNTPVPTGVGNRVDGTAQGQCADLPAESPQPEPPAPSPTPAPTPTPTPTPTPAPTPAPSPSQPPASSPPPAASAPPADDVLLDEGGAGAVDWPLALLVSLLAWLRVATPRRRSAASLVR